MILYGVSQFFLLHSSAIIITVLFCTWDLIFKELSLFPSLLLQRIFMINVFEISFLVTHPKRIGYGLTIPAFFCFYFSILLQLWILPSRNACIINIRKLDEIVFFNILLTVLVGLRALRQTAPGCRPNYDGTNRRH